MSGFISMTHTYSIIGTKKQRKDGMIFVRDTFSQTTERPVVGRRKVITLLWLWECFLQGVAVGFDLQGLLFQLSSLNLWERKCKYSVSLDDSAGTCSSVKRIFCLSHPAVKGHYTTSMDEESSKGPEMKARKKKIMCQGYFINLKKSANSQ